MRIHHTQDGITLLITLVLMSVLLGVSASLLNITLKQYQLVGVGLASEIAFQAASAGMECALYRDFIDIDPEFDLGTRDPVSCFETGVSSEDLQEVPGGDLSAASGEEQLFQFTWGTPQVCTEFSVYKFYNASSPVDVVVSGIDMRPSGDCPAGSVCTVVQSRGYNVACSEKGTGLRTVEREYTQVY